MRGCERKVECFSLFERYVTLPVGTWLIALEQSSRSQCGRLLRTLQSPYFVLREKKETFSEHKTALGEDEEWPCPYVLCGVFIQGQEKCVGFVNDKTIAGCHSRWWLSQSRCDQALWLHKKWYGQRWSEDCNVLNKNQECKVDKECSLICAWYGTGELSHSVRHRNRCKSSQHRFIRVCVGSRQLIGVASCKVKACTAISPLYKLIWPLHVRIRGNWAESVSTLLKNDAIVRSLGATGTKMAPSLCWDFKLSNEGSFVEIGQEMTKLGWKVWKKSLQSLRAELQSLRAESIAVCMQRWSFRRRSLSWETSFDWSEMKVRALPGVSPHPAVRTWPGFQIQWTQPDFSWFFMRTIPAAENRGAVQGLPKAVQLKLSLLLGPESPEVQPPKEQTSASGSAAKRRCASCVEDLVGKAEYKDKKSKLKKIKTVCSKCQQPCCTEHLVSFCPDCAPWTEGRVSMHYSPEHVVAWS